ncbi:MAG TPA: SLBB domain-containing protein [Candidatus Krumholzibacteria bacterium]|nr:SLBB domain-containing protein [Candidatus Krumholzibacteria bacterium]
MFFRIVSSAMILVMLATSVAPAQILQPRRTRDPFQQPTRSTTAAPADTALVKESLRSIPQGFDAPVDPKTYVIGPGDQFVLFFRSTGQDIPLRVLPEGTVLVPNAGMVRAAGLTIEAFRAELGRVLASYYRSTEFFCELVVPRTFVVYVLGEVAHPGPVAMLPPYRVDTALTAAGGVTKSGSDRAIEIRKEGEPARFVDQLKFRRLGDVGMNPMLHEGQTVFVPSRGRSCEVVGEVWRAGAYEILPGETVIDLIELAGGFTTNAERDELVLEQLSKDEEVSIVKLDEATAATTVISDRDVIVVPDKRSFPGIDFVRVQGGGGRDGRIYLQEGETLQSFLPRFIRLRNDFDLPHARIERKKGDGTFEFISIDLAKVLEGDSLDVELQTGDVINIPRLEDVVFVGGEVVRAGEIEFQRGLPAGRYIAMAGGPSDAGSVDKLQIYDSYGNRRDGNRESVVYRGETILVKRRTGVILGNLFIGFVSLTSLFLSVYAVITANE